MGSENGNFDDLQYCRSSKRWVGGPKKSQKHDDVILTCPLSLIFILTLNLVGIVFLCQFIITLKPQNKNVFG